MSTSAPPSAAADLRTDAGRACVVPTRPGVPFWAAIAIAVLATAVAAVVDLKTAAGASPQFGGILTTGFLVGVVLAALLVRRRAIFTAMVQPPLVLFVVALVCRRLVETERLTLALVPVVNLFPVMAIGTAAAVLIGVIRLFAQPLRPRAAPGFRTAATGEHL